MGFFFLVWFDFCVSPALSWKYCMKWKEVLSSVRGWCVYIGWRLEDIKSVIYKLSKYCIKMRHIQQRNLSHFCKVFFWNRNVCKHNITSPIFMFIYGQFFTSECCCWCYLFDQINIFLCCLLTVTQKIWYLQKQWCLSRWDICRVKGSFWITI